MYADGKPKAPNGQARKYQMHYDNAKYCARKRGIDWQFTYDTWVDWWGEDIVNRGPRKHQLVMARIGDIGPYHPDNVHKKTASDNCRESQAGKPKSAEQIQKLKDRPKRTGWHPTPETTAKRIATYRATCAKRKEAVNE